TRAAGHPDQWRAARLSGRDRAALAARRARRPAGGVQAAGLSRQCRNAPGNSTMREASHRRGPLPHSELPMISTSYDDAGKLVLRLTIGILILLHGLAKLMNGVGFIEGMLASRGVPAFFAYAVYVGE